MGLEGELEAGFRVLRHGAAVAPLAGRAILGASGSDRTSFLQGMLTNDVVRRRAGEGLQALLLTEQGRIVADLRGYVLDDEIWLDVPAEALEHARAALERFIVADDVELAPRAMLGVALRGPHAARVLAAASRSQPEQWTEMEALAHRAGELAGVAVRVARVRDLGVDGFHLWASSDDVAQVVDALLAAGAERVSPQALEAQRIVAGWARQGVDYDEKTLAAEVPSLSEAISYSKGCYLGQEVVERIAARGHVNWLLVGLRADAPLETGATVQVGGQEVGRVTSACVRPDDGRTAAMARVRRTAADAGTSVLVGDGGGVPAEVVSIPIER